MKKPKILYVTTALHAAPHGGCMIRTTNICRQLKKYADLTMLAVSPNLVPESVQFCQQEFQPFYKVDLRHYNTYPRWQGRFLLKWHMHNPMTRGTQASKEGQMLFQELVQSHDIVWFHTLGAAHPFKFNKLQAKTVMDMDDLKDCYYQQHAKRISNMRHKWSAKVQAYKWKKHQADALRKFDRIIVCSDDDKTYLGRPEITCVIPNGYCAPTEKPQWTMPDPKRMGFIGLLHYNPNRDGLIWFRDNVWPIIRKQHPDVSLRIIGKLPEPEKYVEGENFEYLGFLEDTTQEMKTWSALVVPITYGGGTRIKILDAFSKRVPVVATSMGAHGIRGNHGQHLLKTDTPSEFAANCIELINKPQKSEKLTQQAWTLFDESYSWDVIGESLKKIIDELTE